MGAGSALEDKIFAEVKRLCYAGLNERMLLREVTGRLRRVAPFEAYCATKWTLRADLSRG